MTINSNATMTTESTTHTHVTFVLDSSGSMSNIADDTKGGFNVFLQEQQEEQGTATVTLYEFNTNVELMYRNRPIAEAPKLDNENYKPGGQTALHDALTRAIAETSDSIDSIAKSNRPDNVIVVVLTDGKENASETPADVVRERVEGRREDNDWEFLFIGANQDAALTAQEMGMDAKKSLEMSYSGEGAKSAQKSVSDSVSRARQEGNTGGFTDEDRNQQENADGS